MKVIGVLSSYLLFLCPVIAQEETVYLVPNFLFETHGTQTGVTWIVKNTHDDPLDVSIYESDDCNEFNDQWLEDQTIGSGDRIGWSMYSETGDPSAWAKISHSSVEGGKRVLKIMQFMTYRPGGAKAVMMHHEILSECPEPKTFYGLRVEEEKECSPYDSGDYRYPTSIEEVIIEQQGGMFSPYNHECFADPSESDIEHIVARKEAHDSGLCSVGEEIRKQFSRDLLNLTLASPTLNRHEKGEKDASEWIPEMNSCWFAESVISVKKKYGLSVDQDEADALESILSRCSETDTRMTRPDCD